MIDISGLASPGCHRSRAKLGHTAGDPKDDEQREEFIRMVILTCASLLSNSPAMVLAMCFSGSSAERLNEWIMRAMVLMLNRPNEVEHMLAKAHEIDQIARAMAAALSPNKARSN
jgi:hypothetical protein